MQIEFHFRQILQVKFYDLSELQGASSTLTKKFKFKKYEILQSIFNF